MQWFDYMQNFANLHSKEIIYISYGILAIGLIQNIVYLIQIPLAAIALLRTRMWQKDDHARWLVNSDITMPISIIIPAYNEELTIIDTVSAALTTQYPTFEVIVVNDGSSDKTINA
jgi:cellulose synthase/poly-beta-1,6-N-acetylglucosamine synthase-like glycosyltransferase